MSVPDVVLELPALIARLTRECAASGAEGPAAGQLWRMLIEPLLDALGWRVSREPGPGAARVTWIRERADGPDTAHAAIDCLRLGSARALFVAVQDAGASVAHAADAVRALRSHGWSAGVSVAVWASMHELAVYDCAIRPAPGDPASVARIARVPYTELAARWDEVARLVSCEAVARALAGARVQRSRRSGAIPVEEALLAEAESWHDLLATDMAARYSRYPAATDGAHAHGPDGLEIIHRAVQRTIQWILFLRMCEGRVIEPPGQLLQLCEHGDVSAAWRELCQQAAIRYGALAMAPHAPSTGEPDDSDAAREPWCMDSTLLGQILRSLYRPGCPYAFSVLSPAILGHVYEGLLSRPIRRTEPDRAAIEHEPEARKASGVYYTPSHLVAFVVHRTVGALLDGKTPRQVRQLRILDPACGSGSFLLGAYRYLLDWHEAAYQRSERQAERRCLYRATDGSLRLTAEECLRILDDQLYGVDIDPRAVAVTRLTLILHALDHAADRDENGQPARSRVPLALHGLTAHLQCGNALVGPDFFSTHGRDLDVRAAGEIRAFDWERAFPEVLGRPRPGFDAVVGNPPWGQKGILDSVAIKDYVRGRFTSLHGIYDLFRPFVEQGIRLTRRGSGRFGMVLPDIVLLKDYQETRRYLLDQLALTHIDWWGMAFSSAVIDAATIVGVRTRPGADHRVEVAMRMATGTVAHSIPQADFRANERYVFNLVLTPERRAILERLAQHPRLGQFFEAHEGVHSGNMRAALFVDSAVDGSCEPLFFGRNEIAPYCLRWGGRFIRLDAVPVQRSDERYANVGRPEWFHQDKLLVRRTGDRVLAAVEREHYYASNNFFVLIVRTPCGLGLDGLCALLNSRLMTWYFRTVEPRKGRAFAELKIKHLSAFPLPTAAASAADPGCAALERLGAERARLARAQDAAESPEQVREREDQIRALDRDIDQTVAGLFGLSEHELRLMDEA